MPERTFLNVDLDVESKEDLAPLAAEFGEDAIVLHCGPIDTGFFMRIESARQWKTPDGAIHAICRLVEGLTAEGRTRWDSSDRRVFDVGVEVASSRREVGFALRTGSLKRVAQLGAGLAVTIYHAEGTELPASGDRDKRRA